MIVYLSLGSNLGDRKRLLREALERLSERGVRLRRLSSFYETAPLEMLDQPWFLNCVAEVETSLSPVDLLAQTAAVETEFGRRRDILKGPRTLDIDILLCAGEIIETDNLVVPHPRLHLRRFVLEPLAELAPDLVHPSLNRTVGELLSATQDQELRKA